MEIRAVVSDSLKYPLSDWKKFLIFGILAVSSALYTIQGNSGGYTISIVSGVLVYGYSIRIIKASMAGFSELPNFDGWIDMFIDGLKLTITILIYIIPIILILITYLMNNALLGILILVSLLYLLIILPIFAIAVANMAYKEEFSAAFKFKEIFKKINSIGWGNLIVWYILMIIFVAIYLIIMNLMDTILGQINPIGTIFSLLLVMPYMYLFLSRSVALEYMSDTKRS